MQETYLRAWRSFDSFDGRGSFRASEPFRRELKLHCYRMLAGVNRIEADQRSAAKAASYAKRTAIIHDVALETPKR